MKTHTVFQHIPQSSIVIKNKNINPYNCYTITYKLLCAVIDESTALANPKLTNKSLEWQFKFANAQPQAGVQSYTDIWRHGRKRNGCKVWALVEQLAGWLFY